ncbi:MAG: hypothetical protein ACI4DU_06160 [Lachnospiraceae bacterium]
MNENKEDLFKKEIHNLIKSVKRNPWKRKGEKSIDLVSLIKEGRDSSPCKECYKKTYNVSVSIWQSTTDYIQIMANEENILGILEEKEEDLVHIICHIHNSYNEIIASLSSEYKEEMADFCPSKVVGVLFDYSGNHPEYSFYVESIEDYQYHVYMKEDGSFVAGSIS